MALAKSNPAPAQINRRDLLSASIAAPVGIAVAHLPVAAEAGALRDRFAALSPEDQGTVLQFMDRLGAETPVRRAYGEWLEYRNWLNNETADLPDETFDELCNRRREMEVAMFALPSRDASDVLLKLLALNDNGNDFSDDGACSGMRILAEGRALIGCAS